MKNSCQYAFSFVTLPNLFQAVQYFYSLARPYQINTVFKLSFQALKRALSIEPNHPELHTCLIRFLQYRQEKLSSHHNVVVEVINREVNRLLPTTDPTRLNEDFLNNNQDSVPHRLQGA